MIATARLPARKLPTNGQFERPMAASNAGTQLLVRATLDSAKQFGNGLAA